MAEKYLEDRDAKGVYEWERAPENQETIQRLIKLLDGADSLFFLFGEKGQQKRAEERAKKKE